MPSAPVLARRPGKPFNAVRNIENSEVPQEHPPVPSFPLRRATPSVRAVNTQTRDKPRRNNERTLNARWMGRENRLHPLPKNSVRYRAFFPERRGLGSATTLVSNPRRMRGRLEQERIRKTSM